ncbi:MAG: hypothetical protein FWE64_00790 [Alphaproteobacteria bacterium]|nr:hypothetical protein [Alphaproteobacteria bacterium]
MDQAKQKGRVMNFKPLHNIRDYFVGSYDFVIGDLDTLRYWHLRKFDKDFVFYNSEKPNIFTVLKNCGEKSMMYVAAVLAPVLLPMGYCGWRIENRVSKKKRELPTFKEFLQRIIEESRFR